MRRRDPKVVLRLSHDLFCCLRGVQRVAVIDAEQHLAWLVENSGSAELIQKAEQWIVDLRAISAEMENARETWISTPSLRFARLAKKLERIQSGKFTKAERKRIRKIRAELAQ